MPDSLGLTHEGRAQISCADLASSCSSAHVMRPPAWRTNPSPWRGPSHSRDRGLVTAWRLAPPATVQVVGGDSNPPPTPPSPLVHILTCPVPVAWQVNLPLHLLQVLFNASFYISHLLLAADRSRNRSRATAAAATCRRPRHRPCPASSRRAGTAARPAHPPRKAAAAGAIDTRAWCRAARGAVAAAVSLPRRRRRRRWTARMPGTVPVSVDNTCYIIIMYGRPRACACLSLYNALTSVFNPQNASKLVSGGLVRSSANPPGRGATAAGYSNLRYLTGCRPAAPPAQTLDCPRQRTCRGGLSAPACPRRGLLALTQPREASRSASFHIGVEL